MISLITLFSKNINLFFVLIVLTLTRLFTYDDLRLNLIISILCFSVVLITGIINHLFKVSKYLKWCYVVGVIGFISILFLEFIDFSIILILDYMVFLSSIIIVTYLFYLYHLSRNKNNNICYKFNQTVIENNYDSLLSNKMTYSVILIEITNLKRLKTIINLGEYNKIISQISCLIKSKVNSMGEVCDLRTDQYCVIFKKDLIDTTNWGIEVCLEIENFLNKYTIPIRIKASYKLMDGKDFVYYYNPQYLLSNI
ncbi:MAG: hypothetical protein K0Q49_893 [Haloplasmataceae bacterium]|nr:hypothetical protein [Haloplasmataceae bacterium]